jgi:hypothetical protein
VTPDGDRRSFSWIAAKELEAALRRSSGHGPQRGPLLGDHSELQRLVK